MRWSTPAVARRALLAAAIAATAPKLRQPALAADVLPESALWPRDGLFPDCPSADVCVSSQDDRPSKWDNVRQLVSTSGFLLLAARAVLVC